MTGLRAGSPPPDGEVWDTISQAEAARRLGMGREPFRRLMEGMRPEGDTLPLDRRAFAIARLAQRLHEGGAVRAVRYEMCHCAWDLDLDRCWLIRYNPAVRYAKAYAVEWQYRRTGDGGNADALALAHISPGWHDLFPHPHLTFDRWPTAGF